MTNLRTLFTIRAGRRGLPGRCLLAAILTALLTHCGGDSKTGSNGTGMAAVPDESLVASGPITSLGPTGIGGTSLEDVAALVQINALAPRPLGEIRLGMVAEAAGTVAANTSGTIARTLTVQSAVVGPVSAIDPAAQRLTVLSVAVQWDQNTILDGIASLASVAIGTRLEVYGLPQPQSNGITATRVIALPSSSGAPVEILGTATGLTSTQFNLQGVVVATSAAVLSVGGILLSPAPSITSIGENARVRVIGGFNAASNTITATQVIGGLNPVRNDNSVLVLDGLVQSTSAAGRFRVNDTDVDASVAGAGAMVPGTRVQVRGRKLAGTLIASEFRQIAAGARIEYIVQGEITDFASLLSFKVRGESINAGTALFTGSLPAQAANGRQVRVKAVAGPGQLTATEVTFL